MHIANDDKLEKFRKSKNDERKFGKIEQKIERSHEREKNFVFGLKCKVPTLVKCTIGNVLLSMLVVE